MSNRRPVRAALATLGALKRRIAAPLGGFMVTTLALGAQLDQRALSDTEIQHMPEYVERLREGHTPAEAITLVRALSYKHDGTGSGCGGGGPLAPPSLPTELLA